MTYEPPVKDTLFLLKELCDLDHLADLPGYEEATPDMIEAILEEAGKFTAGVLAPLNAPGDRQGARWEDGKVYTADGWGDAYSQFVEGGWNGLPFSPELGGMGLPMVLNSAVAEMIHAANMSFALCPMLTQGAVEALQAYASDEIKDTYLPKMVSGEWTGTMNLTEPQAGSDLAAVRSKAVPEGDHYRISGQKIFITYGDHDMTENIIHLVLARLPDAPEGIKGISLFVVPKYLIQDDGSLSSEINDVHCVSLEHKLGIHASPTATMSYGDNGGSIGWLVGEPHKGLTYMFLMMNRERLAVGIQGLAVSDRAYRHALAYARERVQGKAVGAESKGAIITHPGVRRKLLDMKARIEAMRALALDASVALDLSHVHPDETERAKAFAHLELLTPLVKGWCTEQANLVTSMGVQVHGGMGFVEETGAAQFYRDARITSIYEGTTAIQANDLVNRKVLKDEGQALGVEIDRMKALRTELAARSNNPLFKALDEALGEGAQLLEDATKRLVADKARDPRLPAAAAEPFLMLAGTVFGCFESARFALAAAKQLDAGEGDPVFLEGKITTAAFYAQGVMPEAMAHYRGSIAAPEVVVALNEEAF